MRSDPLVSKRYWNLPTIWFHWAVAILVLIQWGIAQVIDLFPAGMPRVEARSVHISLGLCLRRPARGADPLAGKVGTRTPSGR